MKIIKVDQQIPDLVERFQAITAVIPKYVVGREAELAALKVCLLTKQHLLLEGEPGIAKSRFALLAFRAFSDARVYENMFHGQTTTDEVFGPVNPRVLREHGTIEFNTTGMLPQADFAYLDEIFNGPGSVLNSTLNILNERKFRSGGSPISCPLKTAVATTNRISDSDDMKALIDRFLIMRKVSPSDSDSARRKILRAFAEAEDVEEVKFPETLTLKEFAQLTAAVKRVKIPAMYESLLEAVRTQYVSSSNMFVSDRRFCWAYRAMQASVLLATNGLMVDNPPDDSLSIIADVLARRPGDIQMIESAMVTQIQAHQRAINEEEEISALEKKLQDRINSYDPDSPKAEKRKLFARLNSMLSKLKALSPDQQYTLPANVERLSNIIYATENCVVNIEKDLGLRDEAGNQLELDTVDTTVP